MNLRVTEEARCDLGGIRRYTEKYWGEEQADRYEKEIWIKFKELSERPSLTCIRHEPESGHPFVQVGKHLIFFHFGKAEIVILRVLHVSMDFMRHLPPLD